MLLLYISKTLENIITILVNRIQTYYESTIFKSLIKNYFIDKLPTVMAVLNIIKFQFLTVSD
jgi:hypothetical protein